MTRRQNLTFQCLALLLISIAFPARSTWAKNAVPVAEASPLPPMVVEVTPSPSQVAPVALVEPAPKPEPSAAAPSPALTHPVTPDEPAPKPKPSVPAPPPTLAHPVTPAEPAPKPESAEPAPKLELVKQVPASASASSGAETEKSASSTNAPAAVTPRKDLLTALRLIPVSASPRSVVTAPPSDHYEPKESIEPGLGLRLAAMLQKPSASKKIGRNEPASNPASSTEQGVAVEISPPPTRPKANSGPAPAKLLPVSKPAYVVHFGSHFRQDQAVADRDELASVGVKARVYPAPGYYNVEYRVVSAPFSSEADAQRCLADVKKKSKGFRDATIGQDSANP
jgi:hypothetical protein